MQRFGSRQSYVAPAFRPFIRSARARETDARYEEYRAAFQRYDVDGNGRLDAFEIRQVFKDVGVEPSEEELRGIALAIHHTPGGEGLTYEEFILVLAKDEVVASEGDELETLEAYIAMGGEADKSGCVDAERIKQVIANFGLTINIDELLELLDTDHSGQIEYDEFKCLFEEEEEESTERQGEVNPLSGNARVLQLDSEEEEETSQVRSIPLVGVSVPSATSVPLPPMTPNHMQPRAPLAPRPPAAAPSPRHR